MQSYLENPILCPIKQHKGSQILWFKFSQNKDEILQCKFCIQDDIQRHGIVLEQLINDDSVWEVKNFPPLKNEKEIKELLKISNDDDINHLKQENKYLIEKSYLEGMKKISQSLDQQKKNSLQELENKMVQLREVNIFYDIQPLKECFIKYSEGKITLEDLFNFQLKMYIQFCKIKKYNIIIIIKKDIKTQLQNLKLIQQKEESNKIKIMNLNEQISAKISDLQKQQKASDIEVINLKNDIRAQIQKINEQKEVKNKKIASLNQEITVNKQKIQTYEDQNMIQQNKNTSLITKINDIPLAEKNLEKQYQQTFRSNKNQIKQLESQRHDKLIKLNFKQTLFKQLDFLFWYALYFIFRYIFPYIFRKAISLFQ